MPATNPARGLLGCFGALRPAGFAAGRAFLLRPPDARAARETGAGPRQGREQEGWPPDLLRYTAGDSKVAKPLCDAPIDYSRARVTVAPTPAPRYSVGAGEALTGGFSTSLPGMNR